MIDPVAKLRRMSASAAATEAHALLEAALEIDAAVLAFDKERDVVGGLIRMNAAYARAKRVFFDIFQEDLFATRSSVLD